MTDLSSRVDEITTIISSCVRPQLQAHGGDIALLRVAGEQVFVKVSGSCQACLSLSSTIQKVVQETLRSELGLPTLTVTVDDSVSDELIAEALRIIRR
ncbi:NifU family protein [uncultured Porphyromonas sp.]|uniref:NifU family protein n=1 Tax=uncultured Porphyromonas sp. TaxID=159274 RepID=UPI0025F4945A|nr:NifU family protein [uncultured Porphyromonas sp.]